MKRLMMLVLIIYIILGATYSVVIPPFEASDEIYHYPMVKTIADHWELPVQDVNNVGPLGQEGGQAPLYYYLMAAATFWIDTSDMLEIRHLNPHADNGVVTPDGNINLVVHQPARERFPWVGTVLAIHIVRLLSVGMGAVTVALTYLIVRELYPEQPVLALGAAAINAFTPMFIFVSSVVNNDNLAVPLCSLAILLMVRLAKSLQVQGFRTRVLVLGVVIGLAMLTKANGLALLPLAVLVITVRTWEGRPSGTRFLPWLGSLIYHLALVTLPPLLIAGWWYWRNVRLYGDILGSKVFFDIVGRRLVQADLLQLWREKYSFLTGYWGHFGHVNVAMPAWTYTVLNTVLVFAIAGLLTTVLVGLVKWIKRLSPNSYVATAYSAFVRHLALVIAFLWPLIIFVSWTRWARITFGSQGRMVFPAISVWSLLLALGLTRWLPRRFSRWPLAALTLFLLALSAAAPFAWIRPAYALPEFLTDADVAAIPHRQEADFGEVLRLMGYDLETATVNPGGDVGVTLYWEALAPTNQEYTVFVHLLGEGELVVAQRDTFPGLGQFSTTWLEPGFRWADRYVLQVPDTAFAPDLAQVEIGLYDAESGLRLPVTGPGAASLGDNLRFGEVAVVSRGGDIPNPVAVNFGDQMALQGYQLDGRVVHPEETVTLTLYWKGLQPIETDYTISVQLIDEMGRKAAQLDSWPQGGGAPTTGWVPGESVVDVRTLLVSADAPLGVYDVRVVVYTVDGDQFVHLPVIPEGGRLLSDHAQLTRMRVR